MATEDVLAELERWYLEQCDEEWEHSYGVVIGTLDNPGWQVSVDLVDTPLDTMPYERAEAHRTENDCFVAQRAEVGSRMRAAQPTRGSCVVSRVVALCSCLKTGSLDQPTRSV